MSDLFIKKLEYVAETFVSKDIIDNHPKYLDFVKVFLRYLDENYVGKALTITENNDPDTVFSEILDDYLKNYFKDVIDLDKYGLTDDNKRIFLQLHKLITNLKGNKRAFEFLFRSLTDFEVVDQDVEVSSVTVNYAETEGELYTYTFAINTEYDEVRELADRVHPAGFLRRINIYQVFSDSITISDNLVATAYQYFLYNGGITYDGAEVYNHDGGTIL